MERAEIDRRLEDVASWREPGDDDVKTHFARAMRGRTYDTPMLRSAWEHFRMGWFSSESA